MTLAAILQPHYLPWIGYFEMVDRADVFVFLDDVDFIKREWKNRNRIRTSPYATDTRWLTVSVPRHAQHDTPICAVPVAYPVDSDWALHHTRTISASYLKSPAFETAQSVLEALTRRYTTLAELNIALASVVLTALGITTPVLRASELKCAGFKTEKLVNICKTIGATRYLANNGSSGYLQPQLFAESGIEMSYQNYTHPIYQQSYDGRKLDFISHLSIIDFMCNVGLHSAALEIIRQGRPAELSP